MERRGVLRMFSAGDLILIRHAEAGTGDRLAGRSETDLTEAARASLAALSGRVPEVAALRISPARRCRDTAELLWPGRVVQADERLREQDFGDWDGRSWADIPDLGPLDRDALADHAPPSGESFRAMSDRAAPALRDAAREAANAPVAVVAHAGTVRAALGIALGDAAQGLAFEVDPLSVTRFRALADGGLAIRSVNGRFA